MMHRLISIFLSLFFVSSIILSVNAQSDDKVIITIALPESIAQSLNSSNILDNFYMNNPHISVVFLPYSQRDLQVESVVEDPQQHLEDLRNIASIADIVYTQPFPFSVAGTKAGYFLNLLPLFETDPKITEADFYPPALNAFQWDGGMWAIPVQLSFQMFIYDVQDFEEANLDPQVAFRDIQQLLTTVKTIDNFVLADGSALLASVYGGGFYNDDSPNFANEKMAETLSFFRELLNSQNGFPQESSLIVGDIHYLLTSSNRTAKRAFPLPGNIIGSRTSGLAISSATRYPEEAYQVVQYLVHQPNFLTFFGNVPASRQVAQDLKVFPISDNFFGQTIDDTTRNFLLEALETAISASEIRFEEYLTQVIFLSTDDSDIFGSLLNAQRAAINALELAQRQSNAATITIPIPQPTPVLGEFEVELLLNISGAGWDTEADSALNQALRQFELNDSQVGRITLVRPSPTIPYPKQDCFVQRVSAVDLEIFAHLYSFLSVDPLLDADPILARGNFVSGVLEHLTWENRLLGLPMTLFPSTLRYEVGKLEASQASLPYDGWDIIEFQDTLSQLALKNYQPLEAPTTIEDILMLSFSYGGYPVRVSSAQSDTNRVRFDLSSTEAIQAIQAVLDLSKQNLMGYNSLSGEASHSVTFGAGGPGIYFTNGTFSDVTILDTLYPSGRQHSPIAYDVLGFFINSESLYPDACYRLYSFLQKQYELINGVPVLRSIIEDPALSSVVGTNTVDFYRTIVERLDDPKVVILPTYLTSSIDPVGSYRRDLIASAFDSYVLEGQDLEALLIDTQINLEQLDSCLQQLEPFELRQSSTLEEYQLYQSNALACIK